MTDYKTMMLVTIPWTPTEKSFRLIPVSSECPYLDVVYWRDKKVLEINSTFKKQEYAMFPKVDDNGDIEMRKSPKKAENGQTTSEKQERRMTEVLQKYYIIDKEEILNFVKRFAINADEIAYDKIINESDIVIAGTPQIIT
jgi:hypothetical protein